MTVKSWSDAVDDGVSDAMNARGKAAGCPPISWHLPWHGEPRAVRGTVGGGYREEDVPEVLAAWARALGVEEASIGPIAGLPGALEFCATFPDLVVFVWGVVDRDEWTDPDGSRRSAAGV